MIVTLDAKRRLTVPTSLAPASPCDHFDARFDVEEDVLIFRRLPSSENWLDVLKSCPISPDDVRGGGAFRPGAGIGLPSCSRMKVTSPPEVANHPMCPFRYNRSRHSTSSVTWPFSSSGMLGIPPIVGNQRCYACRFEVEDLASPPALTIRSAVTERRLLADPARIRCC